MIVWAILAGKLAHCHSPSQNSKSEISIELPAEFHIFNIILVRLF